MMYRMYYILDILYIYIYMCIHIYIYIYVYTLYTHIDILYIRYTILGPSPWKSWRKGGGIDDYH